MRDFNRAIQINPHNAKGYNNRGVVRAAIADLEGAIADYTQAIALDPDNAKAYFNRANGRSDLGDLEGAIADYTQAIALDPTDSEAYYNRGKDRLAIGDVLGATADFNQAVRRTLKYNDVLKFPSLEGKERVALKPAPETVAEEAQLLQPLTVDAEQTTQPVANDLNDLTVDAEQITQPVANDLIVDATEQVVQPLAVDAENYYNQAEVQRAAGEVLGAIQNFNQAIRIDSAYAEAYYSRGMIRAALRDQRGASADLETAAKLFFDQENIERYLQTLEVIQQLQPPP